MTTNDSGKLNMGGVSAIKDITRLSPSERTPQQSAYLAACLAALAHQPRGCRQIEPMMVYCCGE